MTENKITQSIKKITSSLLEDTLSQEEAVQYLNKIHTHFQQITEITGYDTKVEYLAAIPAAKGSALGLNYAAQCLIDYKRTIKFLKAIIQAIKEKQANHPGELIEIFYAGCGPYATLFTLVAPHFTPKEVQFTLLEINENSVEAAKKLINGLELNAYVKGLYTADAVTFKIPRSDAFHILISETLDALLFRECYVPILFNLIPQLRKDVVVIPENVVVDLSLIVKSKDGQISKEKEVDTILNVRNNIALLQDKESLPSHLPTKEIALKTLDLDTYESLLLTTKVHVYQDTWLNRNESSLTLPLEIVINKPIQKDTILFTYYLEPDIELNCTYQ